MAALPPAGRFFEKTRPKKNIDENTKNDIIGPRGGGGGGGRTEEEEEEEDYRINRFGALPMNMRIYIYICLFLPRLNLHMTIKQHGKAQTRL